SRLSPGSGAAGATCSGDSSASRGGAGGATRAANQAAVSPTASGARRVGGSATFAVRHPASRRHVASQATVRRRPDGLPVLQGGESPSRPHDTRQERLSFLRSRRGAGRRRERGVGHRGAGQKEVERQAQRRRDRQI